MTSLTQPMHCRSLHPVWASKPRTGTERHAASSMRLFLCPDDGHISLRREGREYKTRKGNKAALTKPALCQVRWGFEPPATSGAFESFSGGQLDRQRTFDMADANPAPSTSTLAAAKREAIRLFDLLPTSAQRQALAEFRAFMAGKGAA